MFATSLWVVISIRVGVGVEMKLKTEKDACVNPYVISETELWSDLAHVVSVKNPPNDYFLCIYLFPNGLFSIINVPFKIKCTFLFLG